MTKRVWSDEIGIECSIDKKEKLIKVQGPLGSIQQVFKGDEIEFLDNNSIKIKSKSSLGYFLGRLKSLLEGVKEGYFAQLEITGRGYRFINLTDKLLIKLGVMHYIAVKPGEGVKIFGSRNKIVIFGLDLEEVNRIAGIIRNFQKPDAYKGKGIRYVGEEVSLKVGKKS